MQLHSCSNFKKTNKPQKTPTIFFHLSNAFFHSSWLYPQQDVTDFAMNRWTELTQLSYSLSDVLFQVAQQATALVSLYCGFVSQDQACMRIISFLVNKSLSEPQDL